jgi:hypothetical protein
VNVTRPVLATFLNGTVKANPAVRILRFSLSC